MNILKAQADCDTHNEDEKGKYQVGKVNAIPECVGQLTIGIRTVCHMAMMVRPRNTSSDNKRFFFSVLSAVFVMINCFFSNQGFYVNLALSTLSNVILVE